RSLVPVFFAESLLRRENLNETAVETVELVRLADMPVQADRIELRQQIDAVQSAVDAVRDRDVDDAILARQRHRRLRTILRQRKEPGLFAAAEDQTHHIAHEIRFRSSSP